MSARNTNLIGILSALGAGTFFTINDTTIKFLSGDYALHQVVLIRSSLALIFLLAFIAPLTGGWRQLRTRRLPTHLLRGLFVVFANMMFFMGLAAMPIAEATAVFFVAPLVITVFSVIFLGEQVGVHRWGAVAVGLIGTLFIVRPGAASFQIAALLPMAAAIGYASLHVLTRRLGTTDSAAAMAFYIQITVIAASCLFGLVFGSGRFSGSSDASLHFLTRAWGGLEMADLRFFLLLGVSSSLGGFLISQAYKLCEAGLAAPFEYVAMPLSILWGWLVFGEWPHKVSWIGIALILGAGLYLAAREIRVQAPRSGLRPKSR